MGVIIAGIFVLLLFLHAVREAFHTAGRLYLRDVVEGLDGREGRMIPPSNDQARTVLALRLSRVLLLTGWTLALWQVIPRWRGGLSWLAILGIVMVGDEMARMVGQWLSLRSSRARTFLMRVAGLLTTVMLPLTWGFWLLSRRVFGLEPMRDVMLAVDEEQILIMAREDVMRPIQAAERELIDNIFEFRETIVREIMVPRLDIVAVPVTATLKEALDVIVERGHSRIPVYEGTIDQIVGILYAKDILRQAGETYPQWPEGPLRNLLRPPYFIPDSKRVSELLPEMQQNKVHLAIVVDEYGGTAGIVTIEDVLEEIVGEIQDEYDRELPEMQQIGENEYIINARADLEDVSDFIGVELPDDVADTLGGFIYTLLDRMPQIGDEVVYPPVRMKVLSVDGRRIHLVHVTVDRSRPEEAARERGSQEEG